MKQRLFFFFAFWLALLSVMVLLKPVFMLVQPAFSLADMSFLGKVVAHGLSMDLSMSAYMLAPVALWLIASVWVGKRWMTTILHVWFWIVAFVISSVAVIDAVLYPYWNFRLDSTPVFYFLSSPAAALASLAWYWEVLGFLLMALFAWALYRFFIWVSRLCGIPAPPPSRRVVPSALLLVLTASLIIPIRGGVTVSTMAPGRVYFSDDMRLNHAALNPIFSFVHSLTHIDRLSSQFRFMDPDKALTAVSSFLERDCGVTADSVPEIRLHSPRPDIHLIILESFSARILPSLGGEPIALCLDSIASEGVLFTDFYAESFRTDRALATILSGYPALPSTSVFRYPKKFGNLPSLARSLKDNGYSTNYFYGGDVNFTNMKGYLVATGFDHIVADTDFPVARRLSKWGAHDEDVFARALSDSAASPAFRVIQTSSSHEPFHVPFSRMADERANAFAYADSCLGSYIRELKASGAWNNALVVIVPDHWGAYPKDLSGEIPRHHVPLVITGGALEGAPARIDWPASQSGIAPTVLSLLRIDHSGFFMARDMLSPRSPQFAWFNEPAWAALRSPSASSVIQTETGNQSSAADSSLVHPLKAFMTSLYRDLDAR